MSDIVELIARLRRRADRPTMRDMYDGTEKDLRLAADLLDELESLRKQAVKVVDVKIPH